jgi:hypothetical protein
MMIKSFKKYFTTYIVPTFYGGGSGGGQNTTVQQRNIPTELKPYYEVLLNSMMKQGFTSADNPGKPAPKMAADWEPQTSNYAKGGEVKGYAPGGVTTADLTKLGILDSSGGFGSAKINPTGITAYQPADFLIDPDKNKFDPNRTVAPATALQNMSYSAAAQMGLPEQNQTAADLSNISAQGGLNTAAKALDYGGAGYQAGLNSAKIGNAAADASAQNAYNLGNNALDYGTLGAISGTTGQGLGIIGGNTYGQIGAKAGINAAALGNAGASSAINNAQTIGTAGLTYGQQGADAGALGQKLAVTSGNTYGQMGANAGVNAAEIGNAGASSALKNAQTIGNAALTYGNQGADYGRQASYAGQDYSQAAQDQNVVFNNMNPYLANSLQPTLALQRQEADITNQQNKSSAAQQGAYGGSRQAVQKALTDQGLALAQAKTVGDAYNTAYNSAQGNILNAANLGLQGQQAGIQGAGVGLSGTSAANAAANTGLAGVQAGIQGQQAAMQGAGVGLSGVNAQLAGTAQGMQGAGVGLSGANTALSAGQYGLQGVQTGIQGQQAAMQGAGVGLSGVGTQLQGTSQGMQGAQAGLAGVGAATNAGQYGLQGAGVGLSGQAQALQGAQTGLAGVGAAQAGYGLAGSAGQQLASIGNQQLAQQQSIANMQNTYGAQQQALGQQAINNAISYNDYQQKYPWEIMGNIGNVLNGVQTSSMSGYTPAPSPLSQVAGLAATGVGAYQAFKKKGGVIKEPKAKSGGIGDLAVYNAMKGGK